MRDRTPLSLAVPEASADPAALGALGSLLLDPLEVFGRNLVRGRNYAGNARLAVDLRALPPAAASLLARAPSDGEVDERTIEDIMHRASSSPTLLTFSALWSGEPWPPLRARFDAADGPRSQRFARAVADVDAHDLWLFGRLAGGWVRAVGGGYLDPVYFWNAAPGAAPRRFGVLMPLASGLPPLDGGRPAVRPPEASRTLHDPPPPLPLGAYDREILSPPRNVPEVFRQVGHVLSSAGGHRDSGRSGPKQEWWVVPTRAGLLFLNVEAPRHGGGLWQVRASFQEPERQRRLAEGRWDVAPQLDFFSTTATLPRNLHHRMSPYLAGPLERPPAGVVMDMLAGPQGDDRYAVEASGGLWRVVDRARRPPAPLRGGALSADRVRGQAAALNVSGRLARFFRAT